MDWPLSLAGCLEVGGRWLAGWRLLLRQDEFSGLGNMQDILLPLVDNDHFAGPLHQVSSADPSAMGSREMRFRRTGLGWSLSRHDRN
jgi:hypothetical protein